MNIPDNLPFEHEKIWQEYQKDLPNEIDAHRYERKNLVEFIGGFIDEIFRKKRSQEISVLEIGAGTAVDSYLLAEKFPAVSFTATDLSQKSIEIAQEAGKFFACQIKLAVDDALKMKFLNQSFDIVFSQGVVEHFKDPDQIMQEQIRVLKDGGVLVVDVPQRYTLRTIIKHRRIQQGLWDWGWETEYSFGSLKRLGQKFGLEVAGVCGHEYDLDWIRKIRRLPLALEKRIPNLKDQSWFKTFKDLYFLSWQFFEFHGGYYLTDSLAVAFRKTGDYQL